MNPRGTLKNPLRNPISTKKLKRLTQCAEEKSNESVEDMDRTFAGW